MIERSVQRLAADFISSASNVVSSASIPEEAYTRSTTVAGKGVMQVMAGALAAAASGDLRATAKNENVAVREKFARDCVLAMDFGAPVFSDKVALGGTGLIPNRCQ
jgi:hypothetical protein